MGIPRGRGLQALVLACGALGFGFSASAAATTFKVTKFKDTNDGACNADCSLREAVVAANAHTGADTIDVPAGTYKLTRAGAGEDISATGDLDVRDGVTINGAGAAGTIVDAGSLGDRVFDVHVTGTAHVTISGMTIRGGHVPDATTPGFFTADGGGVRAGGNVTLKKVVLANNTAGHPMTGSGEGGGVAEVGGRPFVIHVEDSTLTGNTAERGGGASEDGGGKLELVRSTLSGNHAQGDPFSAGGGVIEDGGGSRTDTPAAGITIENSTIAGNTAKGASAYGGGIAEDGGGTIDLLNATIAGNHLTTTSSSAAPTAGNVGQDGGGDIAFKDTIVSGGDPANCQSPSGTLTSQGHNLEDAHTCNFTALTDKTGNPLLGPLADNGGPTKTRAPGKGSPAIDAGAGCLPTDQRGVARPQPPGGSCDIGAVEVNLPPRITIITPANGAHYKQGQKVLANYSCSDPEGPADITLCQGPAPNGKPIDTSTAGKHAFTVQAADRAGNTVKKTVHYTVDTTES